MMKTTRIVLLLAGVATCLWLAAATTAMAQPPFGGRGGPGRGGPGFGGPGGGGPGFGGPGRDGPPTEMILDRFDKNKDGKLSKDEVPEQFWSRLSRADANEDGAVTKDEIAKIGADRMSTGRRGARVEDTEESAKKETRQGDESSRRGPPDARRSGRGLGSHPRGKSVDDDQAESKTDDGEGPAARSARSRSSRWGAAHGSSAWWGQRGVRGESGPQPRGAQSRRAGPWAGNSLSRHGRSRPGFRAAGRGFGAGRSDLALQMRMHRPGAGAPSAGPGSNWHRAMVRRAHGAQMLRGRGPIAPRRPEMAWHGFGPQRAMQRSMHGPGGRGMGAGPMMGGPPPGVGRPGFGTKGPQNGKGPGFAPPMMRGGGPFHPVAGPPWAKSGSPGPGGKGLDWGRQGPRSRGMRPGTVGPQKGHRHGPTANEKESHRGGPQGRGPGSRPGR